MKFILIAPRFHTNLYYRVIALQNAGHIVKILVLYKVKSEFYKDIDLTVLKLSLLSRILSKFARILKKTYLKTTFELRTETPNNELKKIFKNFNPEIVLLKAYQNLLSIKILILAKKYNVKVLMLTQTTKTEIFGSSFLFKLNIQFFKYLKVHAYLTPIKSNYTAFDNFGIKNIYYIPFVFPVATNTAEIESKYRESDIPVRIISVGKFVKRKDQLLLLKAFKTLKNHYKIQLDLYGEKADNSYFQNICNYIEENKLSGSVQIFLNTPYSEIIKKYKEYDLFILPSYSEPAAYSPVEAMASGLAVICSNQNGTSCYIENGENGFIFEAKNEQDLTNKIEHLLESRQKRLEVQKEAIKTINQCHNMSSFTEQILKIRVSG